MNQNGGTVVVLTALDLEYDAVRRFLTDVKKVPHPAGTRFEIGTVRGHNTQIALAVAGKGNHSAAVITERAITQFNPHTVLCVGVAGALHSHISLGDVIVATHVYAYHGGTSEDHQFGARPRSWQASHDLEQLARDIQRSGSWTDLLYPNDPATMPRVHLAPIAAGEVVVQSQTAETARAIHLHYNDAVAVEMEGAGVALAGHLNRMPTLVIRGISDMATSEKSALDRSGWQPRAATNAAAFAVALAVECTTADKGKPLRQNAGVADSPQSHPAIGGERAMASNFYNIAQPGASVEMQIGQLNGTVHFFGQSGGTVNVEQQLKRLREDLRRARSAGRIDEHTLIEAERELDSATSVRNDTPEGRRRVLFSMKRLRGLVADVAEVVTAISAIIALVGGVK